jgi:4-hydroxy-2-oxoheptanedioate aldolase
MLVNTGTDGDALRTNRLRDALLRDETTVTGWLSVDSPYLAEVLSHSGYDAVTVDLQHGMFGLDRAITLLQAVGAGPAVPMARCTSLAPAEIGKLLDAGAYGIVCPSVDSADQAADFVRACRYPPDGRRSFGPSRGLLYGGPDYVEHADATILTWAMIESAAALDSLDAILETPGLDAVYAGPNDLALSLGERAGRAEPSRAVMAALERIAARAREKNRWAGAFASDAKVARRLVELGYHLVTPGNDVGIMRQAVAERLAIVRDDGRPGADPTGGY